MGLTTQQNTPARRTLVRGSLLLKTPATTDSKIKYKVSEEIFTDTPLQSIEKIKNMVCGSLIEDPQVEGVSIIHFSL